ncbi:PEP-CTERM sorting domain-containing protein [Gammaproteobacteria bacterium]|nr:PEP-CTERM sorting domain-containing protein [Gammaproteobacteria bacterium]
MTCFKEFTRFILISLALLGLSVSSVNAALSSIDWQSSGDNLLTVDDTGLQWLDLSQTIGQSYNQVLAQLGPGGTLSGFRYATAAEVEGLWDSAGGDNAHYDGFSTNNNGVFDTLAPFWGDTYCAGVIGCQPSDGYAHTLTSDVGVGPIGGVTYQNLALAYDLSSDTSRTSTSDYFLAMQSLLHPDLSYSDLTGAPIASALVRLNTVPVPAAVWLFGTALVGLVGFSRRKSKVTA